MVSKNNIEGKRWTLYRHTSPSNKIYIGITSNPNVKHRWCNGSSYKGCPYFYKAILKYGWFNIKHEVLFTDLTKERAEHLEIELIRHYKGLNISYNITGGGEGTLGMPCPEERKIRMREQRKGIIPWKAIKASVAANKGKKRGSRDRAIVEKVRATRLANGKKCTSEMIQANIDRNLNRCHPVLQYDLDGNLIAEYRSVKYAAKIIGASRGSLINCLSERPHCKTCKGYVWKYKY